MSGWESRGNVALSYLCLSKYAAVSFLQPLRQALPPPRLEPPLPLLRGVHPGVIRPLPLPAPHSVGHRRPQRRGAQGHPLGQVRQTGDEGALHGPVAQPREQGEKHRLTSSAHVETQASQGRRSTGLPHTESRQLYGIIPKLYCEPHILYYPPKLSN